MADAVVGIIAIITTIGLPVSAWIIFRLLAHRERMEMIRSGMMPPPVHGARSMSPGAMPGPYGPSPSYARADDRLNGCGRRRNRYPDPPDVALRKGIRIAMIGMALTIGLSFIGFSADGPYRLGPQLLGGLIPLFIGLGQIMTALLSGAALRSSPWIPGSAAPNGGPPPSQPAPAYDGSYTYRPGDTQELRSPGGPLDPRVG